MTKKTTGLCVFFYHISTVLIIIYHPPLSSCKHFTTLVFISPHFFIPSILIKQCKLYHFMWNNRIFYTCVVSARTLSLERYVSFYTNFTSVMEQTEPWWFLLLGWLVSVAVVSVQLCELRLFNSLVSSAAWVKGRDKWHFCHSNYYSVVTWKIFWLTIGPLGLTTLCAEYYESV